MARSITWRADLLRLWEKTKGDPRVTIAILDGPVDLSHLCFRGADLSVREGLVANKVGEGTASSHGTHIASIIFGQPGGPVEGLAPNCKGLICPIYPDENDNHIVSCSQIDLARAISRAVQEGALVINVSAGQIQTTPETHHWLEQAIDYCTSSGAVVVAAAGNDGCACIHIPGALPSVLVVGAMDFAGSPLEFSNWDDSYISHGILAPGENILGARPGNIVTQASGTSYASAIVSGLLGLLLSLQLRLGQKPDPLAVRKLILDTAIGCDEIPVSECSRLIGGRLNLSGVLDAFLIRGGGTNMNNQGERFEGLPAAVGDRMTKSDNEQMKQPFEMTGATFDASRGKEHVVERVNSAVGRSGEIYPSGASNACSCGGGSAPALVYAIGEIGFDFGSEARRDSFLQLGMQAPQDPRSLLDYLKKSGNEAHAAGVIWTLNQEATPIYAIQPSGAFASNTYQLLRDILSDQLDPKIGVTNVSIPGVIGGKVTLISGQVIPVIVPEARGIHSWSASSLVKSLISQQKGKSQKTTAELEPQISNFLHRVYYELRNQGLSPKERAINFSATNAYQAQEVFVNALQESLRLDDISLEKSSVCRPGSDCWDIKLTFFNPAKRVEVARRVYRYTVDVSDIIPVTVGLVRSWDMY